MIGLAYLLVLLVVLAVFVGFAARRAVPAIQIIAVWGLVIACVVFVPMALGVFTNGRADISETTPWVAAISALAPFLWLVWRGRSTATRPGTAPRPGEFAARQPGTPSSKQSTARPAPTGRTAAVPTAESGGAQPQPKTVFISYRREDSADVTGRLYDRLSAEFGRKYVYKDVDTIPLGVDFREHINKLVSTCDVVLAVIGDRWLTVTGKDDARRLDDERDPVRLEIVAALNRDIPVVPVLVRGGTIPPAEALPEDIAELAYRNGTAVRADPDFHKDVDRLIAGLKD